MDASQVLGEDDVAECVERIADGIAADVKDARKLAIVGVLNRGDVLAKRIRAAIARKLGVNVLLGSVDTNPYRDDSKGRLGDRSDIGFDVEGMDVVLVDDVMSTGRTFRAAMNALVARGRPRSIRTAALIDRGHRELPINADYVGVEVPTSVKEDIAVRLRETDGGKDGAYIAVR